jgi:hypothetical protein
VGGSDTQYIFVSSAAIMKYHGLSDYTADRPAADIKCLKSWLLLRALEKPLPGLTLAMHILTLKKHRVAWPRHKDDMHIHNVLHMKKTTTTKSSSISLFYFLMVCKKSLNLWEFFGLLRAELPFLHHVLFCTCAYV